MTKIVLDLDDVLCDFVSTWCRWLLNTGVTNYEVCKSDIKTYDHFMLFGDAAHDFYRKNPTETYTEWVNPLEGSHEFVEWCHNNFDEVMILSYAKAKDSQDAKKAFVRKHFNIKNIKFSNSVVEKYVYTKDAILMDDYPHNVLMHVKMNDNYGICFDLNGENPWSTVDHHKKLIETHNICLDKYVKVTSYERAKKILTAIKEGNQ